MGLDVYFYRRPFYNITSSSDNFIDNIFNNCDDNLLTSLKQLKELSIRNDTDFNTMLADAINKYIIKEVSPTRESDYRLFYDDRGEEVAYFRKFWWIINRFNYNDEHYATDMRLTKSDIEDIVEFSRKVILTVEKSFKDDNLVIDKSPLDYKGPVYYYNLSLDNCLSFSNSIITDEIEDSANHICESILDSSDANLFFKVCYMYIQFKYILDSTDWDNEAIYLNADW